MHPKQARHDMGEGGFCVCPKCETRVAHRNGVPCQEDRCAKCGAKLLREGSQHHQMWAARRGG
jgi:hypothetical protein